MKKFEYLEYHTIESGLKEINEAGRLGWELIGFSVIHETDDCGHDEMIKFYVFKRELHD